MQRETLSCNFSSEIRNFPSVNSANFPPVYSFNVSNRVKLLPITHVFHKYFFTLKYHFPFFYEHIYFLLYTLIHIRKSVFHLIRFWLLNELTRNKLSRAFTTSLKIVNKPQERKYIMGT